MESPPSRSSCAICLDSIVNEAYLDPCFHRFCYPCILQWLEMVLAHPPLHAKSLQDGLDCPLCKTPCTLLVHNLIGTTFDRSYLLSAESQGPKFFLTTAHARRLAVYYGNAGERSFPERHREAVKTDSSMNRKIWKGGNTFLGYRVRKEELRQWIQRELQALQREEDVDLLMHHVIGILEHFDRELRKGISRLPLPWKASIHDAVEPFLGDNSNLFADEIEKFFLSGLTVEAYDRLYIIRDESCLEDRAPSC